MLRNCRFETSVFIFGYELEYFEYAVMGGNVNTNTAQCKKTMQGRINPLRVNPAKWSNTLKKEKVNG